MIPRWVHPLTCFVHYGIRGQPVSAVLFSLARRPFSFGQLQVVGVWGDKGRSLEIECFIRLELARESAFWQRKGFFSAKPGDPDDNNLYTLLLNYETYYSLLNSDQLGSPGRS